MRVRLVLATVVCCCSSPSSSALAGVEPRARASAVCADYDDQADAQRAADTIDADGDGIYCEALPCPCIKPGSDPAPATDPVPPAPRPRRTAAPAPKKRAQVIEARITSVTDGDTIKVRAFGAKRKFYRVRLIGIDTPETKRPGVSIECGGPDATDSMLSLAFTDPVDTDDDGLLDEEGGDGRRLTLRTDPTQDTFDRFGRLLAYVTTKAGENLAVQQLAAGWATIYVFDERFEQQPRFRAASDRAKANDRGAWDMCGGNFHRAA
jgi:micrococcal nuclease